MTDIPSPQTSPQEREQRRRKIILRSLVATCIFVVGLGSGFVIASVNDETRISPREAQSLLQGENTADFDLFADVWEAIEDDYLRQPASEQEMLYGAIAGTVAGLKDPYSIFFPPEESEEFQDEIQGKFEGIGAEVGLKNDNIVIVAPIAGSPAEKAGLKPGDRILAIDDKDASGFTLNSAVDTIRGEKGTVVKLTIGRGDEEPFEVEITRDTIQIQNVVSEVIERDGKRIHYVSLAQFTQNTIQDLQPVLAEITASRPDGIILDLRNNPGGYLEAAVDVSSLYVGPDAPVVYERKSDAKEVPFTGRTRAVLNGIETVVLVNVGSASASEIVAGALRDYEKATIVGTATFGKGTVQDVRYFDDGSALKLTIAEWLTPHKQAIEKTGIAPDYFVDRTEEDYSNDRDPQKDAAILFFTNRQQFTETIQPPTEEQKISQIFQQ